MTGCFQAVLTQTTAGAPAALRSPAAADAGPTGFIPAPGSEHWPIPDWPLADPSARGLDPARLAELVKAATQRAPGLLSILVIRGGDLVLEQYFDPAATDHREVYSVTKSFTATLVGIAIDRGYIQGVGDRLLDYFPGRTFANPDPRKGELTLEHLLTMTTGLDWTESDRDIQALYTSPDWVQYMLDLPLVAAPGERFNYCTGCSHLLMAVVAEATSVAEATGMLPLDFARQALFEPLGFTRVEWLQDPQGLPIGGWGLQLAPRDLARLGYLYLHAGSWAGRQVVSADWTRSATSPHVAGDPGYDYGYQWWVRPSIDGYAAIGRDGQMVAVIPAKDLVVVFTSTEGDSETLYGLIEDFVLPAVR